MNPYEKDHIETLRPFLAECAVLLKKDGSFPLEKACRIAAYGSGVRYTVKGGTGSGEVNSRYFVTIEQGLKEAGFEVVSADWADAYQVYAEEARQKFLDEIKAKAKREKMNVISASMGAVMKAPEYDIPMDLSCDAAIYVVSRISGEGNDRLAEKGDFALTDSEIRDIRILNDSYEAFMLVINAGGPVDLGPVKDAGNILVLSQLGVETGAALADILLGKACPSGKLTTTWASVEDCALQGDFGERDYTRYTEGIYVGYRYFDAFRKKPVYPFGFGLGYTDFELTAGEVAVCGPEVSVSAEIRNTGKYKGKETLQIYVSCPSGRLDRELKSLAAFAKTEELEPGGCCALTAGFDLRDLAAWDDASASWVLEPGDYIVLAGTSSDNAAPASVLRLTSGFTVRRSEKLFAAADFDDLRNSAERTFDLNGVSVTELDPSGWREAAPYTEDRGKAWADDQRLAYMTADELAYLNTGGFRSGGILKSVVGDSASSVAGAAGETCALFRGRGIDTIIMADGPAGVRISRQYYEDSKGKHSVGSPIPESVTEMLSPAAKKLLDLSSRPKKGAQLIDQFCTAIPIGTAIAQSWNTGFAAVCGEIVAAEMEIFGIDLWLAPALNIHRSVLCGRNFEYFSEDPLISGKFAAALTGAVQSRKGCGVTIKHYAANNQETNRYANDSIVSERALREIYLKGFGICIRESAPMAVMTSYNLINGEHTSESRALTKIAREEFGFDGILMTDWVLGGDMLIAGGSVYGPPEEAKVAAAGCSLFMPGSADNKKAIAKGVAAGAVTEAQLRENAGRLLYTLDKLGKNRR